MTLPERLATIDARIAAAALAAGRDPASITRIVVTKFHPASLITDLAALGVRDIGENRQQELSAKIDEIAPLDGVHWHFIGQLQSNKAKAVARAAAVVPLSVHTVDRPALAGALDRALEAAEAGPIDAFVQVNLTDDPARGGAHPDDALAVADAVAGCARLRLRGVMAVAPFGEDPAPAFDRLAAVSERIRTVDTAASAISAGMTGDFEQAIAAGATHLRIGSAITGNRPPRG